MIFKINDKDKGAIDECYKTYGELIPEVLRKKAKCSLGKSKWLAENIKVYADIERFDKMLHELVNG